MKQLSMRDRDLSPEFGLGPVQFSAADTFPVTSVNYEISKSKITFGMVTHLEAPSPWRGMSCAGLSMFRIPDGIDQFHEVLRRFRDGERPNVKLPDGVQFGSDVLSLEDLPDDCEQECFATSGSRLFHIYWSEDSVVILSFFSQSGTMLDNPLFSVVVKNIRLAAGQWETSDVPTRQRTVKQESAPDAVDVDALPNFEIDLRQERDAFLIFLKQRIAEFDTKSNFGPGDGKKISVIYLGFDSAYFDSIFMVFDTRKTPEVDGTCTLYLDKGNQLHRPQWEQLTKALNEGENITVINTEGIAEPLHADWGCGPFQTLICEAISDVTSGAVKTGLLASLPLAQDCEAYIEDTLGTYFEEISLD